MTEHIDTPEGLAERVGPRPGGPGEPGHRVLGELAERFEDVAWDESRGQRVALVPRERWREFARAAREVGFEMCVDLTAVDHLHRRPRFEVVAMLVSLRHRLRLRMRGGVPAEDPRVPSLMPVYPGANYFEREAYDMFGITFEGHPDLSRILMPDDWEGHPLRKDYPVGAVQVQFKAAHQMR